MYGQMKIAKDCKFKPLYLTVNKFNILHFGYDNIVSHDS